MEQSNGMQGRCARCGESFPVEYQSQVTWFELTPATATEPRLLFCGECIGLLSAPPPIRRRA